MTDLSKAKAALFGPEMLLALLNNHKEETRRVIVPQPSPDAVFKHFVGPHALFETDDAMWHIKPKYYPGDLLWVQEAWRVHDINDDTYCMMIKYRADGATALQVQFTPSRYDIFKKYFGKNGWQSPYFMPKEAARLFLDVENTHPEKLHDGFFEPIISPILTIKAEGIDIGETCRECIDSYGEPCCVDTVDEDGTSLYGGECGMLDEARSQFADLWDRLNKKRGYPWSGNSWVWAYTFKRVYPETGVIMA